MCGCIDCGFESTSLGRGKPELAPLAALSPLLTLQNHNAVCSWCLLPLATERLQPPFGQSWDGGNPVLSTPVALAGVRVRTHAHVLTFMDVSAARGSVWGHISITPGTSDSLNASVHWTCTLLSYTSILNDCASNPMAHSAMDPYSGSATTSLVPVGTAWNCTLCSVLRLVPEFRLPLMGLSEITCPSSSTECNERSSAFPLYQTGLQPTLCCQVSSQL